MDSSSGTTHSGNSKFTPNAHARPIESSFRDENGIHVDGSRSVFSIMQRADGGPQPLGTGFFISSTGIFCTARHVVQGNDGELLPDLIAMTIRERAHTFFDIVGISAHVKADVAVGVLVDMANRSQVVQTHPFSITTREPRLGEILMAVGLPSQRDVPATGLVRIGAAFMFIAGEVAEFFPEGRDRTMLPSRCFQTTLLVPSGASGGAVGFGTGAMFGILSTGYENEPIGFVSSIRDILDLEITPSFTTRSEPQHRVTIRDLIDRGVVPLNNRKLPIAWRLWAHCQRWKLRLLTKLGSVPPRTYVSRVAILPPHDS